MTWRVVPTRRLKQAIWLYIILLIFEGALRRWVLPGASSPLLIVRDPIALFIIVEAARWRLIPRRPAFWMSYLIAGVGFVLALTVGHGDGAIALYGARPLVLHFPAMFIIGLVLDRNDLHRIGRFFLAVSIGMTALLVLQFYSPQTAFVNRGVGGVGGAGFSGAEGYFRPPGTFSFTSGVAQFYGLMIAFVIYFWFVPRHVNRLLLLAATGATLIAIPLSISRSLFFQVLVSLAFAAIASAWKPRLMLGAVRAAVAISLAAYVTLRFEAVRNAVDVLLTRFDQAGRSEGGFEGTLIDRYLGGLLSPIVHAVDVPIPGLGLGLGTNAGSQLLTGEAQFLIAEGEWGRIIGELGAVLGLTLIAVRVSVTAGAAVRSWRQLRLGDVLPWILLSNAILLVPQGSWNQPTSLGFVVVGGGLLLASVRRPPTAVPKRTIVVAP